jgi:glycosyltransferase involved in cell wall biosynthesis
LQNASAVTTNAKELAKKAKALVPGLKVTVVPNGIDPDLFRPLPRNTALAESLSLINGDRPETTARIIGFVGELREKKGLRPLLSAYAQVNKVNAATLLIVGDVRSGEDKQIFDEFKHSHPNAQILVTGFRPHRDLPAYYSLMDVFVLPSLRDGLPNALLEAMACERAVIGTPVGGIIDAIVDCENGRLVSTNNATELAEAIEELLTNKTLQEDLGRAGRQTILGNFTLQSEVDGNFAVYQRLGLKL